MPDWDGDDVALLASAASDLTALAATLEVLRRKHQSDRATRRAQVLVERLHKTITDLIEHLRE